MNAPRRLPCALLIVALSNSIPALAQAAPGGPAGQAESVTRFAGQLVQPPNASEVSQARQEHAFQVTAGQLIEARLDGEGFDTVLQLIPPSGDTLYNDDFETTTTSRIVTIAPVDGEWRAIVSALDQASGAYDLVVTLGTPGRTRSISGSLTREMPISAKGHRSDRHTYVVQEEAELIVQLTSRSFEPELVLHSPSGEVTTQSVDPASPNVVMATVASAEPGSWEVIVTHSANADQTTGEYTIQIMEAAATSLAVEDLIRGVLSDDGPRQIHGEFFNEHTIAGSTEGGMSVVLESDDFDAFLAVRSPAGEWYRDDDSGGDSNARLVLPPLAGEWHVVATSYAAGQTGSYELKVYRDRAGN